MIRHPVSASRRSLPLSPSRSGAVGSTLSDFSSAPAWEEHYAKQLNAVGSQLDRENPVDTLRDKEWHQEIPLEAIVELVEELLVESSGPETLELRSCDASHLRSRNRSISEVKKKTILVIGCGTSRLPTLLLERLPSLVSLVLLDSSPTCIAHLHERYCRGPPAHSPDPASDASRRVTLACGNVLSPPSSWQVFRPSHDNAHPILSTNPTSVRCDMVLDKGMMDVLLCGEGWDSTVPRLLASVRKAAASAEYDDDDDALRSSRDHQYGANDHSTVLSLSPRTPPYCHYILISYRLPPSTMRFLVEQTSSDPEGAWEWSFDRDYLVGLCTGRRREDGGGDSAPASCKSLSPRRSMVSVARFVPGGE
jgi:hypothetical protein